MKEIIINSKKYGRHIVLVDDEDWDLVNQYTWHLYVQIRREEKQFYCVTNLYVKDKKTTRKIHRLILNVNDPKIHVDHINHNPLDNRRCNLRTCTTQQNQRYSKKRKNTISKYKGVCLHKRDKKWGAYIKINTKQIHLGCFDDEKEAALAYNEAAIKCFGEFALLNKIEE